MYFIKGSILFIVLICTVYSKLFNANDPSIQYIGRVIYNNDSSVSFDWSNTQINVTFSDVTSISVMINDGVNSFNAFLDGNLVTIINTTKTQIVYTISTNLASGAHNLLLTRQKKKMYFIKGSILFIVLICTVYSKLFNANDPSIQYIGRVIYNNDSSVSFDWSNTQINVTFSDVTSISVMINDGVNSFNAFLDGNLVTIINTTKTQIVYTISTNLASGAHNLLLTRRSEALYGETTFLGIKTNNQAKILSHKFKRSSGRRIEFIGDSVTCGYGILGNPPCDGSVSLQDDSLTYGPIIAEKLDAEIHVECYTGKGIVRNKGDKNVTSSDPFPVYWNRTLAEFPKPVWDATTWVPQAVVINLGTNDYATDPQPPLAVFSEAYQNFIDSIKTAYNSSSITFFLACGPMISYPCETIRNLSQSYPSGVYYIEINQTILNSTTTGCEGHPNVKGHQSMVSLTLPLVQNIMGW
eukprot:TRINITY_DN12938_c0_g1_i1.p1 TRINITY_DN12938_c0_g1~~TRINITY_DN12938_c0_g1_i1.p1  ORF type:complete len:479 (-),score=65.94 TRINITY_DN12938_c0_g1_i1:51-1454(-)